MLLSVLQRSSVFNLWVWFFNRVCQLLELPAIDVMVNVVTKAPFSIHIAKICIES